MPCQRSPPYINIYVLFINFYYACYPPLWIFFLNRLSIIIFIVCVCDWTRTWMCLCSCVRVCVKATICFTLKKHVYILKFEAGHVEEWNLLYSFDIYVYNYKHVRVFFLYKEREKKIERGTVWESEEDRLRNYKSCCKWKKSLSILSNLFLSLLKSGLYINKQSAMINLRSTKATNPKEMHWATWPSSLTTLKYTSTMKLRNDIIISRSSIWTF